MIALIRTPRAGDAFLMSAGWWKKLQHKIEGKIVARQFQFHEQVSESFYFFPFIHKFTPSAAFIKPEKALIHHKVELHKG